MENRQASSLAKNAFKPINKGWKITILYNKTAIKIHAYMNFNGCYSFMILNLIYKSNSKRMITLL
ncbi:Uncharacterised protein [Staphylococcus agnetis]|nr:Uncharacterised protein [Staphylococcus agnetis]